jgi:FAD binding domain
MLADVETNDSLPHDEMQLCPSTFGPLAIFPMSATRRRIVATVENDDKEGDAPSLEFVRRIVAQRAPDGFEARALHWSSYFRIHHRQAVQLGVGRILIAGDAAHIHSPFGGQGMNTGLQDAWNLIWKLDLMVRGHGNGILLDSYSKERRPVIKSVIEITHLMTRVMGTRSRVAQGLRDTMIPVLSRLAPFQHNFVQRLSQLGIAYRGSPIVEGSGKRFFDESLRGGRGIISRFLLILDKDTGSSIKEVASRLCQSSSDIVELRTMARKGITLVRPDGYVAYASDGRDGESGLSSVRSLLARQTNQM